MLANSTVHNPVIVGSSVHNVRIERLWRDTFRCVLLVFYQLFCFLEQQGKLDPLSEMELYCLHYVYIPRITRALNAFHDGWNNHAITTEHCSTPLQMFTSGVIASSSLDTSAYTFSADLDSNNSPVDVSSNSILVPSINSLLTAAQENELSSLVNPLQDSTDYGVELFEQVKDYVSHHVQ